MPRCCISAQCAEIAHRPFYTDNKLEGIQDAQVPLFKSSNGIRDWH